MYKKILLLLLLMLPLVSAASFVIPEDSTTNFKIPVFESNNTLASSIVDCYITVIDKNQNEIISNGAMDWNATGFFNYTFTTTETAESGVYPTTVRCDNVIDAGFSTFTIAITPTGELLDTSTAITYLIVILIMCGIAGYLLLSSSQSQQPGIKLFFMLLGFVILFLAAGGVRLMMDYTTLTGSYRTVGTALLFVLGITFITIMYYVFVNLTKSTMELMRQQRGFGETDNEEAF